MAFRDDREAMRARIEQLEGELQAARTERDELRGAGDLPAGPGSWFFGGPTRLRFERTVDGELPPDGHEDIVEALRSRFGALGQVSRVGKSLAWTLAPPASSRVVEASLSPRAGRTVIRVSERLGGLAGGLFGGVVGGAGGGGLGFVLPLAILLRVPALIPFLAIGWLGLVYGFTRSSFRSIARRRREELRAASAEVAEIAENWAGSSTRRVRVAGAEDGEVDDREVDDGEEGASAKRRGL